MDSSLNERVCGSLPLNNQCQTGETHRIDGLELGLYVILMTEKQYKEKTEYDVVRVNVKG